MSIPKILHFSLPHAPTQPQKEIIERARSLHPSWEIKIWNDDTPIVRLGAYLPRCNSGAQRGDLIRLAAVFEHGGVYIDSDLRLLRPLDPLAEAYDFFISSEDGFNLTNACFGCTPKHDVMDDIISFLENNEPNWAIPPNFTTGPAFLAKLLRYRSDITVLPRSTFYPYHSYHVSKQVHRLSYAEHLWAATWKSEANYDAFMGTAAEPRGQRLKSAVRRLARPLARKAAPLLRRIAEYDPDRLTRLDPPVSYSASGDVVLRTAHGHKMVAPGSDLSIAPRLITDGVFERNEELFVRRHLQGGDLFIDVGANIGVFSLLAASLCGPFGRVLAFEPNPFTRTYLNKSILANWFHDRVRVYPNALSAEEGKAVLRFHPERLGDASLETEEAGSARALTRSILDEGTQVEVELTRLDHVLEASVPIRILKVDVEGHETEVLRGASRLIEERAVDYIIVECLVTVEESYSRLLRQLRKIAEIGYAPGYANEKGEFIRAENVDAQIARGTSHNIILSAVE